VGAMQDQESRHRMFLVMVASANARRLCRKAHWTVQLTAIASTMSDIREKFVTHSLNLVICSNQPLCEAVRVDFADDAHIGAFLAIFAEDQQRGGTEQLVAVEQGALFGIAVGHVEADQPITLELADNSGIWQDFVFDHLAAD